MSEVSNDLQLQGPLTLPDMGMNGNITPLFFAGKTACPAICVFEPFPKTVGRAVPDLLATLAWPERLT